jgi:hypothetical protein
VITLLESQRVISSPFTVSVVSLSVDADALTVNLQSVMSAIADPVGSGSASASSQSQIDARPALRYSTVQGEDKPRLDSIGFALPLRVATPGHLSFYGLCLAADADYLHLWNRCAGFALYQILLASSRCHAYSLIAIPFDPM